MAEARGPWRIRLAAVYALFCASLLLCAQPEEGSLNGRVTDLWSHPVANATLYLRNPATGAESVTVSGKNGAYTFRNLPPGQYLLRAESDTLGQGELTELVVSAGHSTQIITAMAFIADHRDPEESLRLAVQTLRDLIPPHLSPMLIAEVHLPQERLLSMSLPGRASPESPPLPLESVVVSTLVAEIPLSKPDLSIPQDEKLAVGTELSSQLPADNPHALSGEELRALPARERNWKSFVADRTPAQTEEISPGRALSLPPTDDAQSEALDTSHPAETKRNHEESEALERAPELPSVAEVAIAGVVVSGDRITVQTERGSEHWHGQGFLLERAPFLGAQNPWTRWVRETAAPTSSSLPVFTAEPYTPPDRETTWGVGVGQMLRKRRIFWFAALDGLRQNDPGVSMLKHPDLFFAQPGNDELKTLAARLNLSSANPVGEGMAAYSGKLEEIATDLGRAERSASQWSGFLRLDRKIGERQHLSVEASGARRDSPGGGLSSTAEPYGISSFGHSQALRERVQGQWSLYLNENMQLISHVEGQRMVLGTHAETPSAFEKPMLSGNAFGQLPQIVVDSRYGFTIGNPARFGPGSNPDQRSWQAGQQLEWAGSRILLRTGAELRHARYASSRLRNQTGSYNYSGVENFVSDALVFDKYGYAPPLSPLEPPYCDQTGSVWRDSSNALHGTGWLPCYNSYTQTMGPSSWWLSSNDWAAYGSLQWRPADNLVLSAGLRWEREQTPGPYPQLANPDLPLAGRIPSLDNQWGPRLSLAWGKKQSQWPVLRLGYGVYYGRIADKTLLTAMTNTGSLQGVLHYYLRPTDNLYDGGAPPFPAVLSGQPGTIVKPSAVEMAPGFRNAQIHQAEVTLEAHLPGRLELSVSAQTSLGRHLPVSIDTNIDPAVNPGTITYTVKDATAKGPLGTGTLTVPYYAYWPGSVCKSAATTDSLGRCGRLNSNYQQVDELFSRANSTWTALVARLDRYGYKGLALHLRYTWSHATDWNPDEQLSPVGASVFDPARFSLENGTSDLDRRHAASLLLRWQPLRKLRGHAAWLANGWAISGVGSARSGLPWSMRIASATPKSFLSGTAIVGLGNGMNGYGGDNRVYGVGRNTYRYPWTWKADLRLSKRFMLGGSKELEVLMESFNLFNHSNVQAIESSGYYLEPGTTSGGLPSLNYMTGSKSGTAAFGQPLNINATTWFRERQFDLGLRMHF